ncbi:hypothetical protein [Candidatus Viridilinea mediisalina]|uniref:Fibronectin type-III domain-containing protein n=1 Tax=Candidatus Viridilinea mediisalina TaxID=2024553 RepID=A0A2A6REL7_9CHLR|nr:hypothetical protein [Candidatus Viridilinea mediisalina]PDW01004.1 hypothetical protein CJ255_19845 [Candidatus Viridilinea mediisalina]
MRWFMLLSLVLTITGCSLTASAPNPPLHILVDVEGHAEVKRSDWQSYAPAMFGTMLTSGDELRVQGRATIVCSDLQLIVVDDHQGIIPCGAETHILSYPLLEAVGSSHSHGDSIPLVITPLQGRLLDPRPQIRWTPAHDAEGYRVTLLRSVTLLTDERVVWERDVGAVTSMDFPDDVAALEPGVAYQFVVAVANDPQRSSQQDERFLRNPNLVRLLSARDTELISAYTEQIAALGLDPTAQKLVLATLYYQQRLTIDALALLADAPDEPVISYVRGMIYLQINASLAEEAFQQALAQSLERNDLEGQGVALRILSRLALIQDDQAASMAYLRASLEIYRQIGATETVRRFEASLAALAEE